MSAAHKLKWPTVFSGLKGASWATFPNEIVELCYAPAFGSAKDPVRDHADG